jgi:SNF2 family DNA or RNA helicase
MPDDILSKLPGTTSDDPTRQAPCTFRRSRLGGPARSTGAAVSSFRTSGAGLVAWPSFVEVAGRGSAIAKLEDLSPGSEVAGVVPGASVEAVAVTWHGDGVVRLTYRELSGRLGERLLHRGDESGLQLIRERSRWSFAGDAAAFRLAAEARRIRLGYLFDPLLAVHLSLLEPLPHQIRAVYGEMLPRQPLRFLLADDPGAGKTIMSGLFIKELMLRGDLHRCLVVAPGGLVAQWQEELAEKFRMEFKILTRDAVEASLQANPFLEEPLLIARMHQLSRNPELRQRLAGTDWDLVVVDEAHRMSAHRQADEVRKTQLYELGELLRGVGRHFLLLTATPHSGKPEDFQLFMALLDPDRFEGKPRGETGDVSDIQRRMIKEKILRFDGTKLFPERKAYTVPFRLSRQEMELYERVSWYVREEMNRADNLHGSQRAVVGFALTGLQRRLASSPEAIYRSLQRRRERLEEQLQQSDRSGSESAGGPGLDRLRELLATGGEEDLSDLDAEEAERLDEEAVGQASASRTRDELNREVKVLRELEALAKEVRASAEDTKWVELRGVIDRLSHRQPGRRLSDKLIVFTEYRATLDYLTSRLATYLGRPEAVVAIHGGVHREDRRRLQARFTDDPEVLVMVATDAAGEGINLQRAHLLINYDLPWNPNRIEQRFGRIHRIGQTEVCHMWSLVAEDTREGEVYQLLLLKLEEQREALSGEVFDVLGQALPGRTLRELLINAIRYGNLPEVRAQLHEVIDRDVGQGLKKLVDEHALAADVMGLPEVNEVREQMELAAAQRLQPHFVGAFFLAALERLGGRWAERETDRFELLFVPSAIRNAPGFQALPQRYERVTFEKATISLEGRPPADFLCPGHPLMEAVIDLVQQRDGSALTQGAVLVKPGDAALSPSLLLFLEHEIADSRAVPEGSHVVSRRSQFVTVGADGHVAPAGPAPYLDCRPPSESERPRALELTRGRWMEGAAEQAGLDYAIRELVPQHLAEVRARTESRVEKVRAAVQKRLTREVTHWDRRAQELESQARQGKQPRMNPARARARADDLDLRLKRRLRELDQELQLQPIPPRVVAAAILIPEALLTTEPPGPTHSPPVQPRETEEVDRRAIQAVLATEHRLGHQPTLMDHSHPGFDIRSQTPDGRTLFIEVKGRIQGAKTVTVTRTEILTSYNTKGQYLLALVEVLAEGGERVRYLADPFSDKSARLSFAEISTNFNWGKLWEAASEPV